MAILGFQVASKVAGAVDDRLGKASAPVAAWAGISNVKVLPDYIHGAVLEDKDFDEEFLSILSKDKS